MAKAVSVWRHLCLPTLVVNCFSRSTGIALWCFDSHSLPLRLPARRQITGDRHRAQPGRAFCPMEERWFYNRLSWANEKHHLAYSLAQAKRVLYGSPVCSKPPNYNWHNKLSKAAKVTKAFSPRRVGPGVASIQNTKFPRYKNIFSLCFYNWMRYGACNSGGLPKSLVSWF